ncbi:hypothetical protein M6B38_324985 [Iris pallida]|uniref:Uncharacterized protein n=1 Tax=Iris pallida TaxID=29817 RepID=A0AAX6H7K3_IRIPA|nr:hypothetical protein M6B38_324985 [Iris pallida]
MLVSWTSIPLCLKYNAIDIISRGGIKELCVYQTESSKEDMLSLAKKALNSEPGIPGKD